MTKRDYLAEFLRAAVYGRQLNGLIAEARTTDPRRVGGWLMGAAGAITLLLSRLTDADLDALPDPAERGSRELHQIKALELVDAFYSSVGLS